jgi:hypothetical protein
MLDRFPIQILQLIPDFFKSVYFANKLQMYAMMDYNNQSIITTGCGRVSGI